jgi:F-type H+-transporting ATPase subunit gamma
MASLKDMRKRIASVKATQKITQAMQMVAAAKLRRAQEAAESARPYAERMDRVLANLSAAMRGMADAPRLMVGTGKNAVQLMVVATSDRGLCGPFNSAIVRLVRERIEAHKAQGRTVKILCVGKKGFDQLKRNYGASIVDTITLQDQKRVTFEAAQRIAARIIQMFEDGAFDGATLFYGRFKSVLSQVPTAQQLIPAVLLDDKSPSISGGTAYEYEPDEKEILKELLPRNLAVQVFRALLENAASEQGARMTAMDNATRNAGEMIDRLTIKYNRTRQAMITKELIEIISGAEAL